MDAGYQGREMMLTTAEYQSLTRAIPRGLGGRGGMMDAIRRLGRSFHLIRAGPALCLKIAMYLPSSGMKRLP
jgi:hypothetical protein